MSKTSVRRERRKISKQIAENIEAEIDKLPGDGSWPRPLYVIDNLLVRLHELNEPLRQKIKELEKAT